MCIPIPKSLKVFEQESHVTSLCLRKVILAAVWRVPAKVEAERQLKIL